MFLSDVSVSVNRGSTYDMKRREKSETGTTTEIYYDNIETIKSDNKGHYTELIIKTSAGDDIEARSSDKGPVESAESDLRNRMRKARRQRQD